LQFYREIILRMSLYITSFLYSHI